MDPTINTRGVQTKVGIDAGVTFPVPYPVMDDFKPVVDALADCG